MVTHCWTVLLLLLFCSACCPGVLAKENITWSGCGPIANPLQKLKIGERTVICLMVGNTNHWVSTKGVEYLRLSFSPEIDQYSRFHVANSYNDLVASAGTGQLFHNNNITVGVASQTKVSFLRQYYSNDLKKIYPHLTAIVDVSHGEVRGVTWDDACLFCGGGECEPITYNYEGVLQTSKSAGQPVGGCPVSLDECGASSDGKCDLHLYVVWSGTDSSGLSLQSSASRFSMFPAQDLGDRWSQNVPSIVRREDGSNRDLESKSLL